MNVQDMIDQAIVDLEQRVASAKREIGRLRQLKETVAKMSDEDGLLLAGVVAGNLPAGRHNSMTTSRDVLAAFLGEHLGGKSVGEIVAATGMKDQQIRQLLSRYKSLFRGEKPVAGQAKRYFLRDPEPNGKPAG